MAARDKRDISAAQLSQELGIAYSSAWYLLHRLREAMGQRDQDYVLFSIVELDNTYFGAPKSNGKQDRGTEKTSVLAAVSLTEEGHPRFFKIQVSKLDAGAVSAVALREDCIHHYQVFDKNSGALRWVHTLISNVKAAAAGPPGGCSQRFSANAGPKEKGLGIIPQPRCLYFADG